MNNTDTIDVAALANLLASVNGDTDFLDEMIDIYFDDSPKLLASMRQALATGNPVEFRRAAHSLKSNSANFGVVQLTRLCGDLEALSVADALDVAGPLLAQAEAAYAHSTQALRAARLSIES